MARQDSLLSIVDIMQMTQYLLYRLNSNYGEKKMQKPDFKKILEKVDRIFEFRKVEIAKNA